MITDTIYLFISCCKYRNRWKRISDMCKELHIRDYYIVYGNPKVKKTNLKKNKIVVKAEDNYISLPEKMTELYKFVYKTFPDKHVIKIDDDVILYKDIRKIYKKSKKDYQSFAFVDSNTQIGNYHLYKNNVKKNKIFNIKKWTYKHLKLNRVIYGAGGSTYFLSKKAIKTFCMIVKKYLTRSSIKSHRFEDLLVGSVLKKGNIHPHVPKHVTYNHPISYYKNKKILITDVYY